MGRATRLRVGVAAHLLALPERGGHGRVWNHVLSSLGGSAQLLSIGGGRRLLRTLRQAPHVVLADGHAPLPPHRVPLVVQIHEAGWFEPHLREALHPDFIAYIEPNTERAVRAAEHVIVPSHAVRHDVTAAYDLDPERVHSIHHGVDPTFRPDAGGGREIVAAARGGRDAPYVLYAGVIHPRKNLTVLREAMAAMAAEGFPQVLAIAGAPAPDWPDPTLLEQAAGAELPAAPDRVVRIPSATDPELAGLMAEADAFCLPSLYEGFGLTTLEAMACGAPVIVSDRGALPEVVGDAGLVVPPTAEGVESALRVLLGDRTRAAELGRAATTRARRFTWDRTGAGWLSVLELAAGTRVSATAS